MQNGSAATTAATTTAFRPCVAAFFGAVIGRGEGAEDLDDLFQRGAVTARAAVQCFTHFAQMIGHGATATTDDFCAGVAGHAGIGGHQFGRAVVMDVAFDIFRDAGVALGDEGAVGVLGGVSLSKVGTTDSSMLRKDDSVN